MSSLDLGGYAPSGLPADFGRIVQSHVDGYASKADAELLAKHPRAWESALLRLLDDAERMLEDVRQQVKGPEKAVIVDDLEGEVDRIGRLLAESFGVEERSGRNKSQEPDVPVEPADPVLQLSWMPGRIVAWAAGPGAEPEDLDQVKERLAAAGVSTEGWKESQIIKVPGGGKARTLEIPLHMVLGWLAALGFSADDETFGPSVTWMGLATALAVDQVAQGRIIPTLRRSRGRNESAKPNAALFQVRWEPVLVDQKMLTELSNATPGTVAAINNRQDPLAFTNSVLTDLVNTIARTAASRVEVPAPPPAPRSRMETGEAFIGHLNGETFEAPSQHGADLVRRLTQWSRPIAGAQKFELVLQLSPPDDVGAWYLAALAPTEDGDLEPVEAALVNASKARRKDAKDELTRLERLYPTLARGGEARRAEVILSQDEAWELMTRVGPRLQDAGFDVRVPALSRKKPSPSLRLTSEEAQDTVVGAQQLANVRWSALFDDIELTAEDISRLAAQARPLVKSRGKWVELDKQDLAEAAAALAERADQTRLTGADMLRHALGLEGGSALGGISIAGEGWAADLLRSANDIPDDLPTKPDGFSGELRSYQADALAWLGFLDNAGLGGCLALDMGLGKTPTMLANIALSTASGTSLVIAPPAVVGNWAAEARKFVPGVKVTVHHGPRRAEPKDIPAMARKADLVITTYGTAVRDVDALAKVSWGKVVLDEAQAIKNPASDTAQQLRKLPARSKVALTGTPIENGLGDLWAILDFANPGLVGGRPQFISQLSQPGDRKAGAETALQALNGILVFRRTKAEPAIAAELPDRIDELDHCAMTPEQIGLYQAVLDELTRNQEVADATGKNEKKGAVLAAITALKQICNHPVNFQEDDEGLEGRSGKLSRLNEIMDTVFAADERMLIFTHFASWGEKLAGYLSERTGKRIQCYHGGLARGARDRMVSEFQSGTGAGALVLSLKAGGTGLNLTAANHVVLYDRWWNPAVEDQARDRVWRIGQKNTVICHRLVCPGTIDERVEEVVAGKRQIADMVLPKSSSIGDLDADQLQQALGIDPALLLTAEPPGEVDASPKAEVPA